MNLYGYNDKVYGYRAKVYGYSVQLPVYNWFSNVSGEKLNGYNLIWDGSGGKVVF